MSLKIFFLLSCGIVLNQILFASAQSDIVLCNAVNPSPDNICTLEFNPVCAYSFVCFGGEACEGFTAGNPCEACEQRGFDYYTLGPCEGDRNGNEEEGSTEGQPPTEGVAEEGGSGENTENGEGEGEGGDGIFWCSSLGFVPTVCTLEYAPVCAYSATEEGSTNGVTIGNGCVACLEGYDYYTEGACPEDGEGGLEEEGPSEENTEGGQGIIWCNVPDLSATDVVCTLEYDPVCAYYATGESSTGVTVGNACQACLQQGFDYYTPGACEGGANEETGEEGSQENNDNVILCDIPDSLVTDVFCTLQYDPVCAYHTGDEGSQGITVGNACQACYQRGFDYYTPGACEGTVEGVEESIIIVENP